MGPSDGTSVGLSLSRRAEIALRAALELEPLAGVRVLRAVRYLQSQRERRSLKAGGEWRAQCPAIVGCGTLVLPPTSIARCSLLEFGPQGASGRLVPGDCDLSPRAFVDSGIFSAMKGVLKDQSCLWEDTPWYAETLALIVAGQTVWECRSEADLQRRLSEVERLYSNSLDAVRGSQAGPADAEPGLDRGEVGVAVGRGGEVLLCHGAHLLGIALLLGLPRLAVQVRARHPSWAAFREELFAYADHRGGTLYQPALHFDLAGIPSTHGCEDRWRLISSNLRRSGGSVLDIGANLGYFDNRLEDLGYHCIALESDATVAHFMKGIRDANGHTFEVVADSIPGLGCVRGRRFDVVLALSIFHHFLKTRREYMLLERLLDELHCDEMFFEPHANGEPQMAGVYANMSAEAFARHIADRTGLAIAGVLGGAGSPRRIYHLVRMD